MDGDNMVKKIKNMKLKIDPKGLSSPLELDEGYRIEAPVMGVDVHKDILQGCVLLKRKKIEFSVVNNEEGIYQLISHCRKHAVYGVAMESTGQYHWKLVYSLIRHKINYLVTNPRQIKETQGKKTDKFDAMRIAIAYRDGRLQPSLIPPKKILEIRSLVRYRLKITSDFTKAKNQITQFLDNHDSHLKQYFSDLFAKTSLTMLQTFIKTESTEDAITNLSKRFDQKKEFIRRELKNLIGTISESEKIYFHVLIQRASNLFHVEQDLKLAIIALVKEIPTMLENVKLLMTIPGVGENSAIGIMSEVVDVSYFPSPKKLAKWAGLAPIVKQSGQSKKKKHVTGRIYKAGNRYLRRHLTASVKAMNMMSRSNKLCWIFKKPVNKKEPFWKNACAVARRLIVIIWHMLSTKEPWNNAQDNEDSNPEYLERLKKIIQDKITILERKYKQIDKKVNQIDNLFQIN